MTKSEVAHLVAHFLVLGPLLDPLFTIIRLNLHGHNTWLNWVFSPSLGPNLQRLFVRKIALPLYQFSISRYFYLCVDCLCVLVYLCVLLSGYHLVTMSGKSFRIVLGCFGCGVDRKKKLGLDKCLWWSIITSHLVSKQEGWKSDQKSEEPLELEYEISYFRQNATSFGRMEAEPITSR